MRTSDHTCVCVNPIELKGMRCGACGRRRIGDDLTALQFEELVTALSHAAKALFLIPNPVPCP